MTNPILIFTPLQKLLDAISAQRLVQRFRDSVSMLSEKKVTPLARAQYSVQENWLKSGAVSEIETIFVPRGIVNPVANKTYFSLLSGILVRP